MGMEFDDIVIYYTLIAFYWLWYCLTLLWFLQQKSNSRAYIEVFSSYEF